MNAEEIISGVTGLQRKVERLEDTNENLFLRLKGIEALANVGIEKIVDDATRYMPVAVRRNNGEVEVETFDCWKNRLRIDVPNSMSKNDLMGHIEPLLKGVYESSRVSELSKLEEDEADE